MQELQNLNGSPEGSDLRKETKCDAKTIKRKTNKGIKRKSETI
jgi:hypothetical protein